MVRAKGMTLDVKNSDEVVKWFNEISEKAVEETKDHINKTSLDIQKGAKKRVPVDDGYLRSSIIIEPYQSGFTIDIGTRLEYGAYVEWGTGIYAQHPSIPGRKTPWIFKHPKTKEWVITRGMPPQPYLIPSYDENKQPYIKGIERIYKDL